MHHFVRILYFGILVLAASSCTSFKQTIPSIRGLRFLDEYVLPSSEKFGGTTVGGLSGIDYDEKRGVYYLICDDRSDINPVRFYTAKIHLEKNRIRNVELTAVTYLLQPNGQPFHNRKQNPAGVPDPEAIRIHRPTGLLAWSSEGERTVRNGTAVLTDPAIFLSRTDGSWVDTFRLPALLRMAPGNKGPRNNGALEALAFSPDGSRLFAGMEEPLYNDGPRAGVLDTAGLIRIVQFNTQTKKQEAQYAYPIDPVVQEPISEGLFVVNGVTDILALNNHQLLVTERSFSTGRLSTNVRVYLTDLEGADDVSSIDSLQLNGFKPLQKRLLLDMDRLGRLIDNIEGATMGPRLPGGKRSLLFVSDNNFDARQKSQVLLFGIE